MTSFTQKTAIITGAGRGIGAATAYEFAALGANVVLVARSTKDIEKHADNINNNTDFAGKALALTGDVADYKQVKSIITKSLQDFDSIDFLINNAGIIDPISRLDESKPEEWSRAIDINIKGVYNGMHAVIPPMRQQGHGVIVNLSSGAANNALEGWSHYCTSKAAVKMLTMSGHKEYAESGITVVGLSPGTVATDMMSTIKESGVNPVSQLDWSTHIPPEWPAKAIAFLCTDQGKPYSGTDFSIKTPEGRALVGLNIPE
ncbi:MAG: SDR family oxidoreductase [Arenicella sp.]